MTTDFIGNILTIDGHSIRMAWPVLDAIDGGDRVFVLLDPDAYLCDPHYKKMRRRGAPAIRNLVAIAKSGVKLWEAELPEYSDYYYRISSSKPLVAMSFSSHKCEISTDDGTITRKDFLK
jgi:hypothetical protein